MKLSDAFKGIGMAVVGFFVGRAFVMGINPFVIGFLTAACLTGENMWLIFVAAIGGMTMTGSMIKVTEYAIVMIIIMVLFGIKNAINIRGMNYLTALTASLILILADIFTGYTFERELSLSKTGISAAMLFATIIIFKKGIEGVRTDYMRLATDNETAIGILAISAATLYGLPLNVGGVVVAQSFVVFSVLYALYKFGFGPGLAWTVIASAIISVKTNESDYLVVYLILAISIYAFNVFIDGGRLLWSVSYLIIYYTAGFAHYDLLLTEEGQMALYSALLVFVLAPNKMMLRVDEKANYYEPLGSTPEWGRLVVGRVNRLADAFKRIEYTFAGETGSGIGFNDVGLIIENFTNQLNELVPIRKTIEADIVDELSERGILVKNIMLIKNPDEHYEVYINARVRRGSLVAADSVRRIVEDKMKVRLLLKDESRGVVSRNYEMLCMIEKPDYKCETSVRRLSRYEDEISGDNFYIGDIQNGQKLLLIADGMGNGESASRDSNQLIDSLEELLNAGFDKEMSIKVVNSYLADKNKGESFSTLDMMLIDLYSGCGRIYKQGAATTFIKRGEWIELIKSTSLPVGVVSDAICEKCMKKLYSGDMIVMVSDGLLESIIFENKEDYMKELILTSDASSADDLADAIVDNIKALGGNRLKDDATIIVCKIVKSL